MKIVYIYPALDVVGGADRVIINKANYFADVCGYDVTIITALHHGSDYFFHKSDKVKHIDLKVDFNKQYQYSFLIRGLIYFKMLREYKQKLSILLNKIKADICITTISRDIDFLHTIQDGSIKIAEAHVSKKYIRNFHILEERNFPYPIIGKIWTWRLEHAAKKFAALVVLTDADSHNWEKIRSTIIIPNSIPFYPERPSTCKNKKIISVGRLCEQKGFDMLIKVWTLIAVKHKDWVLNIYGNGELKDDLTKAINENNIQKSMFIFEPVKNIADKYTESSIYIMSSRFEGFGMVLIEAMSCGIPAISFDCPNGPSDVIENNVDGYIVENGNIQQLADKLEYLMEHEDLRIQMGQKARQNILRYSENLVMQKWIDLFKQLMEDSAIKKRK